MNESALSKGQQTRELLLEIAFTQFTVNGFHGTSMRQIASAAAMTVAGIYNHFANKDELLTAVMLRYHPLNIVAAQLSQARGLTGEMLIRDVAQRVTESVAAKPAIIQLLFIELVECQGRHLPALLDALMPPLLGFAEALNQREGTLRIMPPTASVRILIGSLFGYVISEKILSQHPQRQNLGSLTEYVEVLLHGLIVEKEENA